jgi:diguanylate cyclase (GGDEF)-like protein
MELSPAASPVEAASAFSALSAFGETVGRCLTEAHDLRIVAVAAVVCAVGTHSAFAIGSALHRSVDRRRQMMLAAAGIVATASSIWATHFIAMLAYRPGFVVAYKPFETTLSFVVALLLVSAGAIIQGARDTPAGRTVGWTVIGLAVAAMHYTGMAGFDVPGRLLWDRGFILVSVAGGVLLSVASVHAANARDRRWRPLAGTLFVLAVVWTHFLGMAGLSIEVDLLRQVAPGSVSPAILLVAVLNVIALILGLALLATWLTIRGARLRAAEARRLRDLADVAIEGLLICEGERIVGANRSIEAIAGMPRASIVGRSFTDLVPGVHAADVDVRVEREARLAAAFGEEVPVRLVAQDLAIADRPHRVVAVRDQRERLRTEAEIRQLADFDPLTGLPNRRSFIASLEERLPAGRRRIAPFALLMVDLDRFKPVNDTLGHAMGDALLRRVSGRLRAAVRDGDLVARLGGDEFAILAAVAGAEEAATLADRVIELVSRPYVIAGQVIDIGASAGVALGPADGATPELLSQSADVALYAAKEAGRGMFRMFEGEMDRRRRERRALELDLRRAVARADFEVHFQPLVDAGTGRYSGAEALVRWHHPERGLVPPSVFIPLAEEIGLVGDIGEFVLSRAAREAAGWPADLSVAVNLSPVQLRDPGLVALVDRVLRESGLDPSRLELELTETALLQDDGRTLETLVALRAMGVRLAMDDFGTGYSSLSYLARVPFDKIKIDKSFVQQVTSDRNSSSIVRAITTLGSRLGMAVTAEGVETEGQRRFMTEEGATQIQGYLVSRPLPAAQVRALFQDVAPPVEGEAA